MRDVAQIPLGSEHTFHDRLNLLLVGRHPGGHVLRGVLLGDENAGPEHVDRHVEKVLGHILTHVVVEKLFREREGVLIQESLEASGIGVDEVESRSVEGRHLLENQFDGVQ